MKEIEFQKLEGFQWKENGQSNLSGRLLDLFIALDSFFVKLAGQVHAKPFLFPTFIQAKELHKLDYFASFPQLINFPVALDSSDENLKRFAQNPNRFQAGEIHLEKTAPICDCLTPAACYHFYIHHQGQKLNAPLYMTTRGVCYRRESYYAPLQRQWNFNMREIVCIGSGDEVKEFLSRYRSVLTEAFKALRLNIDWEVATDPFFDAGNPKLIMQQLDPVKEEMTFAKSLSIGSINFHKNYFGEHFQITYKGEAAFSGCVAFGLERWIYAILSTYGTDPNAWPWKELRG